VKIKRIQRQPERERKRGGVTTELRNKKRTKKAPEPSKGGTKERGREG